MDGLLLINRIVMETKKPRGRPKGTKVSEEIKHNLSIIDELKLTTPLPDAIDETFAIKIMKEIYNVS